MKSLYLIKPYLEERRIFIVIGIVCLITVDFLQLFIPRVIKWAIDDLTDYRIDMPSLLIYALYIVGIAVLIGIFRYIWRRCLLGTSRRVEEGLRNKLFAHIQTLSASYFVKTNCRNAFDAQSLEGFHQLIMCVDYACTPSVFF